MAHHNIFESKGCDFFSGRLPDECEGNLNKLNRKYLPMVLLTPVVHAIHDALGLMNHNVRTRKKAGKSNFGYDESMTIILELYNGFLIISNKPS